MFLASNALDLHIHTYIHTHMHTHTPETYTHIHTRIQVGVWSPFADRLVFKLTGHSAPLLGVEFIKGTPQIISADSDG